jgi:histidinol phosphatase-like enzyme (inositol monophosphatase family)
MNTASPDLSDRLQFAVDIARQAGEVTLKYFQQENYEVDLKADNSPVTIADQQAEQLLRNQIATRFPEDGIIGEEYGKTEGSNDYCWVLDPIDGTKSFISGVPLYGTLVGVLHQQQGVVGVIFMPGLDEMIYAGKGQGAWYQRGTSQPQPARVSTRRNLQDAVVVTTQIDSFASRQAQQAFHDFEKDARITRTWGDCYGYLLVATGRADIMIDPIMNIWDAAAIQPILEEAGGTFTDWQGVPSIHQGEGVGTNGHLLEAALKITATYPGPS